MKIPYIGRASALFKRRMMAIVKQTYDVDLYVVFNSFKVKDYFSLKSEMSPYLKSNVVYKYTCQRDADISYLGETNHHIGTRIYVRI